jgi:hypothetical protein
MRLWEWNIFSLLKKYKLNISSKWQLSEVKFKTLDNIMSYVPKWGTHSTTSHPVSLLSVSKEIFVTLWGMP